MFNKYTNLHTVALKTLTVIATAVILTGCGDKAKTVGTDATTPAPEAVIEFEDETVPVIVDGTEETKVPDDNEEESVDDTPDPSGSFFAEEINDDIFARMDGKSFAKDCTTKREDLKYLHLLYKDIDGNAHEGEMVCNAVIADKLISIFRQLYDADYPIEKMVLIDEYNADDDASMSDNNTSCFNYRLVSGTNSISKHGLGLAVDLNPRYNPYVHTIDNEELIEPENGAEYADRSGDFDYKIDEEDLAYKLFTQEGFTWGGSWKNSKDYQHFQYTP